MANSMFCARCGEYGSDHVRCEECEAWLCPDREEDSHYIGCDRYLIRQLELELEENDV